MPLWGCPLLRNFDASFNQLQNIQAILSPFSFGDFSQLQYLKFNDNALLQKRGRWVEKYIARLFTNLLEINDIPIEEFKDTVKANWKESNVNIYMNESPREIK